MAYFIDDLLIPYSIILKLFHTSFHNFTDLAPETFTIWAQFPVILAIWTKNGPKLPSKFAYPPSFDCLLQKSCPRQRLLNCTTRKNIKFCTRNSRKQNFVPDPPPYPLSAPGMALCHFVCFNFIVRFAQKNSGPSKIVR